MGTLPSRSTPGAELLRDLARQAQPPRVIANFIPPVAPVADAVLDWIATNLDEAIEEVRRGPDPSAVEGRLRAKLLDSFVDTFAEVRCLAQIARSGARCLYEPDFPNKGPDLRTTIDAVTVNIEVTRIADDEATIRRDRLMHAIKNCIRPDLAAKLGHVAITVAITDEYPTDSGVEKKLRTSLVRALKDAVAGGLPLPSTLYFNSEWVIAPGHHHFTSGRVWDDLAHPSNRRFSAVIAVDGKAVEGPWVSMMGDLRMEDPERLRKKITKKLGQLEPGGCNVVVLDIANDSFAAFGMEEVLFGSTEAIFESMPGDVVKVTSRRRADGAFDRTSRVSAVVTTGWGILPNIMADKFEMVSVGGAVLKNGRAAAPPPDRLLELLRGSLPFPPH